MVKYLKSCNKMKNSILILIIISIQFVCAYPLFARGEIRRLKGIADEINFPAMDEVLKQEAENYKKAKAFLYSPKIEEGLSKDFVLKECGEPVARVHDDAKWVYKPPSSTFFEGEKIYFIFDQNDNLYDWKLMYQK